MQNPWVYVDDSDPSIVYSGSWLTETGLMTGLNALTAPESLNTPAYGTLHTISRNGFGAPSVNFWYQFKGTDFAATFRGVNQAMIQNAQNASCTIDGVRLSFAIFQTQETGMALCFNEKLLSPTSHNLSISLPNPSSRAEILDSNSVVSFDWLAYNPLKSPEADEDMLYSMNTTNTAPITFLFQFHAGIYGRIGEDGRLLSPNGTTACSSFSYSVDSSLPVNVTLETPAKPLGSSNYPQLLFQTPPLLRQQHTLNITCLTNGSIPFFTAVVQNKTESIDLTPVPSVPSVPSTADGSNNSRHINSGIIAAIALSVFFTLLIFFWFWRREMRRRTAMDRDRLPVAEPFTTSDPAQTGRFRLAQYTTAEKTNKYRQAFGIPIPEIERQAPRNENEASDLEQDETADQPRQVRYRVHEDGGEVANEEDDVISLPPIYDAIARSRPQTDPVLDSAC